MSAPWRWDLLDASGEAVAEPSGGTFPTQSEAESWMGQEWSTLLDAGVESVTLLEGDTVVYGPMSLNPAQ